MFQKIKQTIVHWQFNQLQPDDYSKYKEQISHIKNPALFDLILQSKHHKNSIAFDIACKLPHNTVEQLISHQYEPTQEARCDLISLLKGLLATDDLILIENFKRLVQKNLSEKLVLYAYIPQKDDSRQRSYYNFLDNTMDYFYQKYQFTSSRRIAANKEYYGIEETEKDKFFVLPTLLEMNITNTKWFEDFIDFSKSYHCVLTEPERVSFFNLIEKEKSLLQQKFIQEEVLINFNQSKARLKLL